MDKNAIRGIVFLVIFAALAFIALQMPVFALAGVTGKSFTLFEFFGPVAGAFIGLHGVIAVGLAKLSNAIATGSPFGVWDIAKMTPMMFAAYYFYRNGARGFGDKLGLIVPVAAMAAFWLHPVGQQAWVYALYWLIPVAMKFLPERLVLRSLGSTFTAHAVGSVLFLYTIPTAPALWLALIPVVALERGAFALGISASHIVFTNVMNAVDRAFHISKYVNVERQYVFHI
jgi:hypothetical protein